MAIIELSNISHSYAIEGQQLPVLHDLNMKIEEGELVAIQGPSGSGKSTLLYLLGCLMKVQTGTLRIAGQDIFALDDFSLAAFRNKQIGFIFQQFHLLARTSVIQNILLPTQYSAHVGIDFHARAVQLAEQMGLGDRLDHLPNQLSGGQQQRVAIARALINDPRLILADEPTGNLDSKASAQIIDLLKELHKSGKTVVIITHDSQVARQCNRIFHVKDGSLERIEVLKSQATPQGAAPMTVITPPQTPRPIDLAKEMLPLALANLRRNKLRSFLTMTGITIGIAAVLSMVTLGEFTKTKILASYQDLGINTLNFQGDPNWRLKAIDKTPVMFRSFNWERDILPLRRIFPQIQQMSPLMIGGWGAATASFGGRIVDTDIRVLGVSEQALGIVRRELLMGTNFSPYQITNKSAVCILGFEIAQRLFYNVNPLGQILMASRNDAPFGCEVIGVLKSQTSNKDWMKPNFQIIIPYTFFQATSAGWWEQSINQVVMQVRPGVDVERTGIAIKNFFERKYGKSGRFRVDSDSVLLAQMNNFLTLFTVLLSAIALITLAVGGVGITNMMLVSVSERYREIGLRKALGATDFNIRMQFLVEAILICTFAGIIGLLLGFMGYEASIWGISKIMEKLPFAWIIDWGALLLAVVSIAIVGILSGFFPALKAEKLQVIEALRSE